MCLKVFSIANRKGKVLFIHTFAFIRLSIDFDSHILLLCLDFDGTSAYFVLPFHFSDSDTKTSSSSHLALISYFDVFQAILNCLQYVSTIFLFSQFNSQFKRWPDGLRRPLTDEKQQQFTSVILFITYLTYFLWSSFCLVGVGLDSTGACFEWTTGGPTK